MSDPNVAKSVAAKMAAALVEDGMCLGLGSGSTFLLVVEELARRIRDEGLKISGVPTSSGTEKAALTAGISIVSLEDVGELDLAIDGADEIDPQKNMIKGGGAALVREKIVAAAAREMVVVVDENKLVDTLGKAFALPIEVMAFGVRQAEAAIAKTGCEPVLRRKDGEPLITDNGNYIIDCNYGGIDDPAALHDRLNALPGVLDNGLFVGMAGRILVGHQNGQEQVLP